MFDEIPENKVRQEPCPKCESGNATESESGDWHCDTCDWCFIKSDSELYGRD